MGDSTLYSRRERFRNIPAGETGDIVLRSVGEAFLHRVTLGLAAAGTVTVYNANAAAGEVIAIIDSNQTGTLEYGVLCSGGLTINKTGAADLTVIYQ